MYVGDGAQRQTREDKRKQKASQPSQPFKGVISPGTAEPAQHKWQIKGVARS